ncbi:MAG: POTRA domain-containing protein, partial [Flavobacteriaceae bacterium]|nr:POTRA domain-containing protein [Flavobacteriaceae bacterium]
MANTKYFIENKYKKNGFFDAEADIKTEEIIDSTNTPKVNMSIDIDKGKRLKIKKIDIEGNQMYSDAKVRGFLSNTKRKRPWSIFKRSKYVEEEFKEDLTKLIDVYKERGFRDARVVSDSVWLNEDNSLSVKVEIEEGQKFYFGNIEFMGNTVYSDRDLQSVLRIKKGEVYNGVLLDKQINDFKNPDAQDLTNLYQNSGYLFSRINVVETKVENDTIDFEIRIYEGKQARYNRVTVKGNDRTNDHVAYRNLWTRPGETYSKAAVVRSIRELGQTGFFNPENINPDFINPNPIDGTIDIEYQVEEQGSSQIELQGGFGAGGFVGTLGLSFRNFSIQNIFDGSSYRPLPMGDGQTFSLRFQASQFFRTLSLNFVEPWLGGKKPKQLQVSLSQTTQFQLDTRPGNRTFRANRDSKFNITGISVGLAKQLRWPDDFFQLSHAVSFQYFDLKNFNNALFTFGNGNSNNLAYTIGITRNNTAVNPIFPTSGSRFSLTGKFTIPYSLFGSTNFKTLGDSPEFQNPDGSPNQGLIDQRKFRWLEYYKIRFDGTWYTKLVDKFVIETRAEFGFLGFYNRDIGLPPFERFFLGGDGLGGGFQLDGREIIRLRGYPNQSLSNANGGAIFNKYSLELRYPITLKAAASIYALTFIEGGASFDNFKQFNPFVLNRSAGFGMRIFMPAFGLLGLDFAYGFDPIPGFGTGANGWETHFII